MHSGTRTTVGTCAVDEHNTVLHQGLGTDQFVVGCIIDNIDYSCLACTTLRAPREVPHIQPQGPVFLVASPHTDCVYAAGASLCVGSGASQLILPLLVVGLSLAPSLTALVPVVPRDAIARCRLEGAFSISFENASEKHHASLFVNPLQSIQLPWDNNNYTIVNFDYWKQYYKFFLANAHTVPLPS